MNTLQGWRDDKGTGQKPASGQRMTMQGWRDDENPFDLLKNYGPTTAFSRSPSPRQQTSLGAYSPPKPKQNTGERRQGQASPAFSAYQQTGGGRNPWSAGNQVAVQSNPYATPSMGSANAVNGYPVAVDDPAKYQRPIDDMKRLGTWDDPRNAAARARMERELSNARAAPPGYFFAPDGGLEPNYVYGGAARNPGQASPAFGAAQQPGGLPAVPPTSTAQAPTRQFTMPQMDTNTRDAFIYNINNSLMRQQAEGLGTQAPRPPQFDFQSLYNNAQQMAADGWRNPLAGLFR